MRWFMVGAVLASVSSAALAFQETKGGTGAPGAAAGVERAPTLDLKDTGTSISPSTPQGLEIRIPGLGKLGVLPKLDFGLELLYGANESKSGDPERGGPKDEDDMKIRGAIRHRW